jgi:hypothetical protein
MPHSCYRTIDGNDGSLACDRCDHEAIVAAIEILLGAINFYANSENYRRKSKRPMVSADAGTTARTALAFAERGIQLARSFADGR